MIITRAQRLIHPGSEVTVHCLDGTRRHGHADGYLRSHVPGHHPHAALVDVILDGAPYPVPVPIEDITIL